MRGFSQPPLARSAGFGFGGGAALADPPGKNLPVTIGRICNLIQTHAGRNALPPDFFARLIWKESRFDPNAVSPAGAEGIAQFMPGTAAARGLANSFDVEQAITASAAYLGELRIGFGNLGLAAAAYNAGENRVSRWLSVGRLPAARDRELRARHHGRAGRQFRRGDLCRDDPGRSTRR